MGPLVRTEQSARAAVRCARRPWMVLYGMLLNSLKLGKESVFHLTGEEVESIWVLNPFKNLFVVLTPFGLGVTARDPSPDMSYYKEGLQLVFRLSFHPRSPRL